VDFLLKTHVNIAALLSFIRACFSKNIRSDRVSHISTCRLFIPQVFELLERSTQVCIKVTNRLKVCAEVFGGLAIHESQDVINFSLTSFCTVKTAY